MKHVISILNDPRPWAGLQMAWRYADSGRNGAGVLPPNCRTYGYGPDSTRPVRNPEAGR